MQDRTCPSVFHKQTTQIYKGTVRLQGQPSATADVDGREIKTGTHDGRMCYHAGPQLPPRGLPKAAPWGGNWLTTGRQLEDAVYSQAPDLDSPQKRN